MVLFYQFWARGGSVVGVGVFGNGGSIVLFVFKAFVSGVNGKVFSLVIKRVLCTTAKSIKTFNLVLVVRGLSSLLLGVVTKCITSLVSTGGISICVGLVRNIVLLKNMFSYLVFTGGVMVVLVMVGAVLDVYDPFFETTGFGLVPRIRHRGVALLSFGKVQDSTGRDKRLVNITLTTPLLLAGGPICTLKVGSNYFLVADFVVGEVVLIEDSSSVGAAGSGGILESVCLT